MEASGLQVRSAAEIFAAVARDLAETDGVRPTLEQLVGFAVSLVPCHWAAAVVADHITSKPAPLSASSEPSCCMLWRDRRGGRDEPGVDGVRGPQRRAGVRPGGGRPVRDLSRRDGAAHPDPLRAVLRPGHAGPRPGRHDAVLPSCVDAFHDEAITRASVLADHAAVAIEGTIREDRAHHLQRALGSNRLIGTATGILVERYKLTPQQAFDLLRSISQNSNRKLVDIAETLVATEVPQYGRGPSSRPVSGASGELEPHDHWPRIRALVCVKPRSVKRDSRP